MSSYKGTWRRFDIKKYKIPETGVKFTILNDYAHHPTEIKATLEAAKEKFPKKEIIVVFQPHQYQRTFYLFNDFVKVLSRAPLDRLVIVDVYDVAGREQESIKKAVSSEKLVEKIKNKRKEEIIYIPTIKKAAEFLTKNLKGGEVVIVMGAGDIYDLIYFFHLT